MIALLMALSSLSEPPRSTTDVVVTGRRAERDLTACIARSCPPAEEMELSLQASVQQFEDGRYRDAMSNLRQTIQRNSRHAAAEPALLSSLHSTLATVARHQGDVELSRLSTYRALQVLNAHMPEGRMNAILARLDVVEMQLAAGDATNADRGLRAAVRDALEAGESRLAASLVLRRAGLAAARGQLQRTREMVAEARGLSPADDRRIYEVGEVLIHRAQIARGDRDAVDRLAASLRQTEGVAPTLIHQPPLAQFLRLSTLQPEIDAAEAPLWADIGFWVRPDGRTAEVAVLRGGGGGSHGWATPIVRQIEARRYVAREREQGDPGSYRIERVTRRSEIRAPINSRIRRHVGMPRYEIVDLTHLSDSEEAAESPLGNPPPTG